MKKEENKSQHFLQYDRFSDYLRETKVYKELLFSKEGVISCVLALIITIYIIYLVYNLSQATLTGYLTDLLSLIISGAFGLLGFLVGGMAIIVGSISDEMLDIIDKGRKFTSLLSIVFRFYYDGVILGLLIIMCLVDYFILITPIKFNAALLCILSFINSYLFFYTLLLSVMLLGTSIRLMILRHSLN